MADNSRHGLQADPFPARSMSMPDAANYNLFVNWWDIPNYTPLAASRGPQNFRFYCSVRAGSTNACRNVQAAGIAMAHAGKKTYRFN
jgi:hypothetical protein